MLRDDGRLCEGEGQVSSSQEEKREGKERTLAGKLNQPVVAIEGDGDDTLAAVITADDCEKSRGSVRTRKSEGKENAPKACSPGSTGAMGVTSADGKPSTSSEFESSVKVQVVEVLAVTRPIEDEGESVKSQRKEREKDAPNW